MRGVSECGGRPAPSHNKHESLHEYEVRRMYNAEVFTVSCELKGSLGSLGTLGSLGSLVELKQDTACLPYK